MTDMRTVEKIEHGSSTAKRVDLNSDVCRRLASRYIALDTETTGLDPEKDRIVELGAVLFEKGIPTNTFRSYVNPGIEISEEVSAINHISNELLQTAPAEKLIYPQLIRFLGDAIDGETMICGHVAAFDMSFLCRALDSMGISSQFQFVDTRQLATKIPELKHHGLGAVAEYFRVSQGNAHHAEEDALTSGRILWKMITRNMIVGTEE